MISRPLLEFELIDADDNVYLLGPETRHALEISGLGMPPISHWTTRSPFQHGRTHWGYAYGVRPVDMVLVTKGCGRDGMYAGRAANIVMLDPANSPLKLRLRVPRANLVYELHGGWYTGGYELSSGDQSATSASTLWTPSGSGSIRPLAGERPETPTAGPASATTPGPSRLSLNCPSLVPTCWASRRAPTH